MTSPNQMADPFVSTPDRRTQLVSFDLYERYSLAAQFVSALRGASPYAVLDVGGHSDVLWPGFGSLASAFIPDVKTFVIDLHREPGLKDYAVGSALSLPFSDRSFEFVLAADTLEHIPAADRQSFLHELLRVARGAVLLSFPFRTPLNEACERLVYRYIQMRKQVELPAFREHLELGLPEIETVRQWVKETGLAFRIWNHGNTMLWLRMMLTKNHLWAQGAPEFGQELDAIFNVSFAAGDYREPCYRAFVAVSREPGNDAVILNGIDGFRPGRLRAEDHDALFDLCGKIMESTSSLEVERRTQHSINIIEALGRSLEGQAERDKGHYEFLLEEQRQRAQDAENRLAEAASQLAHHKNLLEEQRQRAQDAENRLAEASSQLAHHKNLLEEQRRRAQDAENRLAEASSQLAHHKNLLEEQRRRAQDAENRLAEASSQLAHHKNLLEEQQRRAEDAENRLAEASSQAGHYKNLTEEQQRRAEDAENRLAEASSQAGHYKSLSEEQQRRAGDAENRLAEASSQAGHYKSLSEEQQRRAEDAENRLAEASSQAGHYKDLSEEQQRRAEDAENRLAEAVSQAGHYKDLSEEQQRRAEDAENRLAEASSQAGHYKNLSEEQQQRAEGAENRLAEASSQAGHYKDLSEEQQRRAEGAESRLQEVTSHPLRFALSTIGSRPRA
jgi:ubiquinone/menaquinone biosynthesis C-methylase UbiE